MTDTGVVYVIGCGVLGPEIKHLAKKLSLGMEMKFLPGRLHNTPELLRITLQDAIDEASRDPHCLRIIIAYGLCGKGTVGIEARVVPLVFPRIHDCISLFLGSDHAYQQQFKKYPGTYYITEGWCEEKKSRQEEKDEIVWAGDQALGCNELRQMYGEKNGKTIIDFLSSWKENYQRAAYINTGVGNRDKSYSYAKEIAKEHNWLFEQLEGDLSLLKKLLVALESDDEVLFVPAGHRTIYSTAESSIGSAPIQQGFQAQSGSRHLVFGNESKENEKVKTVRFGLGLDAGGTYTDGVIYDFEKGKIVSKNKALTTKWDFSKGIKDCLDGLEKTLLQKIELVSVSSTLATNALVEGEGQRVGLLLMDAGLASGDRIKHTPKRVIKGRQNIFGEETEPVNEQEVRQVVREMVEDEEVTAFAVSGFAGTINPAHEQMVREIVQQESALTVCCGHELSSELNFVVRAHTATVNGRIIPRMISFFRNLDRVLASKNIMVPVMVVKGDGTLMEKNLAMEKPVETILSGPAASVAGARHLTGLDNAMVVDIGGTTTDSAEIVNGEVAVCAEGAVVGGVSTHVQALKMKTVGLGGDSHIQLRDGIFTLGPKRVAPLVWAEDISGYRISTILEEFYAAGLRQTTQTILVALPGPLGLNPTSDERNIYDLLLRQPLSPENLANKLGILSHRLLPLSRLEESGLVQRSGLTPTDILHVRGEYLRWPVEPALRMLELLSQLLDKDLEKLTVQLLNLVTESLATELLKSSVFGEFSPEELTDSPVYLHIRDTFLGHKKADYSMQVKFRHPIIGIGAPAAYFLPKAGKLLEAHVLVPENADVANALGAITSHILVRRSLTIRPTDTGGFVVEGIVGTPAFKTIAAAEEWAIAHLRANILEDAKKAGTKKEVIEIDIDDRLVFLTDGNSLFLERTVSGYLKGNPDIVI